MKIDAIVGSIDANDATLDANSHSVGTVQVFAGVDVRLDDATVLARRDVMFTILGHLSAEDAASEVDLAVLKAPDLLALTGTVVGTAADDDPGTMPCR